MNVLFDFRKHESIVSTKTVQQLCRLIKKMNSEIQWAFIISRKVSLGMANMDRALLEVKNIEIKTFESEDDAIEWISIIPV